MAGQQWAVAADGGHMANPELSKQLRYAAQPYMKFMQFLRQEPGMGKGKGDSIDFDKISNIATATSQTGLTEGVPMPETKFTIRKDSLTVNEFGNSIPYTGKLEALAQWDPNNIAMRVLRDDQAKTLDAITASYFKACQVTATPISTAGSGSVTIAQEAAPSTAETRNVDIQDIFTIVDYMKSTLKVPFYDGENYVCVGSVKFIRGIKGTSATGYWQEAAKYGDPERLFTGEVGKIDGVRFIETNNDLALEEDIGGNGMGEGIIFGEDPVIQGVVIPPEVRAKIPTDYGRSKGVAWYALLGWATPWRATVDSEARSVWITGSGSALGTPTGY